MTDLRTSETKEAPRESATVLNVGLLKILHSTRR